MSYSTAILAMEAFFNTGWASETPVVYTNDAPEITENNVPWVRFTINHADGRQKTMGSPSSNRFEHIGIVTIQIFTPEGDYAIRNRELTDLALELYQGAYDSGVCYEKVRADELGNDGFGWYQTNVTAEFRYDTIT